jgi:putative phosphonate metabolism protein
MRYALYFTPDRHHPLTVAVANWLGRDAFGNARPSIADAHGFDADELSRWTAEPRRYGFHATLVAPFRLRQGLDEQDVFRATKVFAEQFARPSAQRLTIARLDGFLALVSASSDGALGALAGSAVDCFRSLRAPLTEQEIARRNPDRLTERQRAYLDRYGYPYVKDEFRFHMTLTGPVSATEAARIEPVLSRLLAPILVAPVAIDAVALFVEPEPGAPFTVHSTYRLSANETRETTCHAE